mmetsp:Transcript_9032/g.22063  ORF Transcript_9032/g.22063 Transcript_9032/m.22063 type:complete len:230 (+) Transcript_9032:1818-2507(+)
MLEATVIDVQQTALRKHARVVPASNDSGQVVLACVWNVEMKVARTIALRSVAVDHVQIEVEEKLNWVPAQVFHRQIQNDLVYLLDGDQRNFKRNFPQLLLKNLFHNQIDRGDAKRWNGDLNAVGEGILGFYVRTRDSPFHLILECVLCVFNFSNFSVTGTTIVCRGLERGHASVQRKLQRNHVDRLAIQSVGHLHGERGRSETGPNLGINGVARYERDARGEADPIIRP